MKRQIALYSWIALAIIYLLLNILIPPDKATLHKYGLTTARLHMLDVTILLPLVIIWLFAFVGYIYLSKYARSIASAKDGVAFNRLSYGVMFFAYGLPIAGIISTILKWIVYYHPGFIPSSTIISNYLSLIVPLVAFYLISDGIYKLIKIDKIVVNIIFIRLVVLALAVLSITYTYLTFHQPNATLHAINSTPNVYYLPTWLIMFTIVLPYVFMWSIGYVGILHIILYRHNVKGILYRRALTFTAAGLAVVLFSYVALEYLTSLTNKLLLWHLGGLLAIIYAFLLFLGVGYALIALGAKRLQKIEDV